LLAGFRKSQAKRVDGGYARVIAAVIALAHEIGSIFKQAGSAPMANRIEDW
jgi:hypothetical protein